MWAAQFRAKRFREVDQTGLGRRVDLALRHAEETCDATTQRKPPTIAQHTHGGADQFETAGKVHIDDLAGDVGVDFGGASRAVERCHVVHPLDGAQRRNLVGRGHDAGARAYVDGQRIIPRFEARGQERAVAPAMC